MVAPQIPTIFISYSDEDKDCAASLWAALVKAFAGFEVFFAPKSIRAGAEWQDKIFDALQNSVIVIVIASPQSIKRLWVFGESCCGRMRKVPVIPICISGMASELLPEVFKSYQAVMPTKSGVESVVASIAEALKCEVPEIDASDFIEICARLTVPVTTSCQSGETERFLMVT